MRSSSWLFAHPLIIQFVLITFYSSHLNVLHIKFKQLIWFLYIFIRVQALDYFDGYLWYCSSIYATLVHYINCSANNRIFYGLYLALEVAYYTYIYAKVDKQYYHKVTAHIRVAMFLGKLEAGFSSQLLINLKLMNYKSLHYITLSCKYAMKTPNDAWNHNSNFL